MDSALGRIERPTLGMRRNNTDDDLRGMIDDSSPIITLRALVLGVLTIAVVFYYVVQIGQGMRVGSYVKSQFPMRAERKRLQYLEMTSVNIGRIVLREKMR